MLLEDLNSPSGVALHEGNLYIAEIDKILVIKNIEQRMALGTGVVAEIFFDALLTSIFLEHHILLLALHSLATHQL